MARPNRRKLSNETEENLKPYDYDTDPWFFFQSSHVVYFLASLGLAIVVTALMYLCFGFGKNDEDGLFSKDAVFGKTFTNSVRLGSLTENLTTRDKGKMTVKTSVEVVGHVLRSDIQILATFPSSTVHKIDQRLLNHTTEDFELAQTVNSLHQRLIIHRLGTTSSQLSCPLQFKDFQLTASEKCSCSATLVHRSFISMKIITFRHGMLLEDIVGFIRKNQSFEISSLPAVLKTGTINATKSNTITHRYALQEAEYQHTEIVKLIPPHKPESPTDTTSILDNFICYASFFNGDSTENSKCNSPTKIEIEKPSPSSCRHISRRIKDFGMRNIPDTIISVFFCH